MSLRHRQLKRRRYHAAKRRDFRRLIVSTFEEMPEFKRINLVLEAIGLSPLFSELDLL